MTAASTTKSGQHLLESLVRTAVAGDGNGNAGAGIQGVLTTLATAVTVPAITDPDVAKVDVTVTGVALGDMVVGLGWVQALETNCRFVSAQVLATDTIRFTFASEGGNVTGGGTHTVDILVFTRS